MRRLGVAVVGLALVAGCSGQTVAGTPVVDANSFELFDPCEIPAESVRAAGADPDDVVARDYFGVEAEDWDLCGWDAGWFYLTVLSTTHTFQQIKDNPQSYDFQTVPVGARDAVSYIDKSDTNRDVCEVAFAWTRGAIVVSIDTKGGLAKAEDPCAVAVRSANVLDPVLRR
ncbi:hypothetical protein GCM10007304_12260 [Rhodococcoides trifolii]|uniref:DUF3558 domain-containing protein n=1 Tax=Rhodococcoides trifolii TaxID=908250 RepID=A0A917CVQ8_9NOCA|nr:DUF3558 domain-containing protein [Rhodococcus trifolii]GGF99897.1 hypothetical protein GCM10007304_12260 [Rhodococcus trifolii]